MTPDLQKYYENQFNLFIQEGWKEQSLFFRKGQLDILDLLLQRKTMCEKTYEELINEKDI